MSKLYPWYRAGLKQNSWEATLSIEELGFLTFLRNNYWESETGKLPTLDRMAIVARLTPEQLEALFTPRMKTLWTMAKEDLDTQRNGNNTIREAKAEKMKAWRAAGKKGKPVEDEESTYDNTFINTSSSNSLIDASSFVDNDDDSFN